MTFAYIFIVFFIITIIAIFILFSILNISGCKDKNALNYDNLAIINDSTLCLYKTGININCKINNNRYFTKGIYGKGTKDNKTPLSPTLIMDRIIAMASHGKSILVVDDKVILDGNKDNDNTGLYIIVFARDGLLTLRDIKLFNIMLLDENRNMATYIENNITSDDIVIVLSKGYPFSKSSNMYIFKIFGSKIDTFGYYSNYLLIGSKKCDIFYESISDNPVFFPYIKIKDSLCKFNLTGFFPISNNLFYYEKDDYDEKITRCALESAMRDCNKFAIMDDRCIPLSNDAYSKVNLLQDSDQCFNGVGNIHTGSVYTFDKITSMNSLMEKEKDGVIVYSNKNYTGFNTILNEGIYDDISDTIKYDIKSIVVPKGYCLTLVFNIYARYNHALATNTSVMSNQFSRTFFGPIKINKFFKIVSVNVKLIKDNSVIFCNNDSSECFVYDIGKYMLPGYIFIKVSHVTLGPSVKKVNLYSDWNFRYLVQSFESSGDVTYPTSIKSIEIL